MAWEKFINKQGRKDVRPAGAPADSVVVKNDAYRTAKRQAVKEEQRQKALADFNRDFARTAAIARRKNLDQSGKG